MRRELQAGLPGHTFAVGRSRAVRRPRRPAPRGDEALLAANVAEGDAERPVLAFEETGAYRLLLSAMSEDPAELQRFYAETVEPLVAYDEQYETDLVRRSRPSSRPTATSPAPRSASSPTATRSATGSSACASSPGSTSARPTGARSSASGLKAMRVLGIAHRGGPASEAGTSAGRVPRPR